MKIPAAAILASVMCIAPARGADSSGSRASEQPPVVAAERHDRGRSARDLIGQEVQARAGNNLGQVIDLVVDPEDGKIVFALVGSGGLLGVGDDFRAVPFKALQRSGESDEGFTLDVDQSKWERAPKVPTEQIASLNSHPMARQIFEYYGVESEMQLTELSVRPRRMHLMRVNDVTDKHVLSGEQEVGEVEDVIVDFGSARAAVVLDPNDDYTGTDEKFIINFSQLTPTENRENLATGLSRADFQRAAPAEENWWATTAGYPYVWDDRSANDTRRVARGKRQGQPVTEVDLPGRPSVTVVRGALRNNADLPEPARLASVEREGDKLVITGRVSSEALKKEVGETVARAAEGWRVENRLQVSSASE